MGLNEYLDGFAALHIFNRRQTTSDGSGYGTALVGAQASIPLSRDRVAADNLYIESWSLGLDVAILAKTALIIFRDPQAY